MGIKDTLSSITSKKSKLKELQREYDLDFRAKKLAEDRQKTANERELERLQKEEREKLVNKKLEEMRWRKWNRDNYGHKILDTPNTVNKSKWEVMKEKNQFAGKGNIFSKNKFIHHNNKSLFKNSTELMNNGPLLKSKNTTIV